jgi:putative membrane protein
VTEFRATEIAQLRSAAERNLLAWVRTGVAVTGLGFVVARFGLFLREVAAARETTEPRAASTSQAVGVGLIALGVAVNGLAGWSYRRSARQLARGELPDGGTWQGQVLAIVLAAAGAALAVNLAQSSP